MSAYAIFLAALALAVVSTLSLLAKNEGIRGMGRVFDGLSRTAFGVFFLVLVHGTHELTSIYAIPAYVLIVLGLVTFASGARKFARRKLVS